MSNSFIDPNDPRLTAYVLDELDETERAAVKRQIENCPQTRTVVDEIRALVGELSAQLEKEPAPKLSESQHAAIEREAARAHVKTRRVGKRRRSRGVAVALVTVLTVSAAAIVLAFLPPVQERLFQQQPDRQIGLALHNYHDAHRQIPAGQLAASRYDIVGARSRREGGVFPLGAPGESMVWDGMGDDSGDYADQEKIKVKDTIILEAAPMPLLAGSGTEIGVLKAPSDRKWTREMYLRHSGLGPAVNAFDPNAALESGVESPPSATTNGRLGVGVNTDAGVVGTIVRNEEAFPAQQGQELFGGRVARRTRGAANAATRRTRGRNHIPSVAGGRAGQEKFKEFYAAPMPSLARLGTDITDGSSNTMIVGEVIRDNGLRFRSIRGRQDDAEAPNAETYQPIVENEFLSPFAEPLSTFSIDVDTASYANVRRFLKQGRLPPADAVRLEEFLNYFRYDDPQPRGETPFSVNLELGVCPWNAEHRLVRVGLKGREIPKSERPVSNLVFLLDVSGSMQDANKLPLVKSAMELLIGEMSENDRIAIVTYAGKAGLVLDSTSGEHTDEILSVIRGLNAGGSTNGEAGIRLAYAKAVERFTKNGANRVILCTDGDFNVGTSGDDELVRMIQEQARSGVFLSIFGFGMGNLKDAKLEKLADHGNGHYGYIDDLREARKVFVEELTGTLYTIAKDVKIQIEFNPQRVGAYRLIGYENRLLAARDFNDDTKDAGEIGAGHSVTALYEIIPAGKMPKRPAVAPLKYQKRDTSGKPAKKPAEPSNELLTLSLRYKQPDGGKSVRLEIPLLDHADRSGRPSRNFEWASAVAAFGMILRDSKHKGRANFDLVLELAAGAKGDDESGRRREFLELVRAAKAIVLADLQRPRRRP